MTTTLTLHKPHKGGQRAIYRHPARFQVVACGRRFGKTAFGELLTLETMFKYGGDVWWVSPTYKMSSSAWRTMRDRLKPYARWISNAERTIELGNGATLTVWTATHFDTMRGGAPKVAIVDEAAMVPTDEMWNAVIRPALMDHNGRAVFLSTPRGRNWFWTLFNMGNDPLQPDFKSWQFPSWFNPAIRKDEIEKVRLSTPELFYKQEYEAEFLEDVGTVFRGVSKVATGDTLSPYAGEFVIGVDWGRMNDYTVITVFDLHKRQMVDMDRFNQISWNQQLSRLKAMADKWRARQIIVEQNSIGDVLLEQLQQEGLPVRGFLTTGSSKGAIIQALALAIETQGITLLNDRVLISELQAYEMNVTRAGNWQYGAPDGTHDDTVMATAIAWDAIVGANQPVKISVGSFIR